MTLRAWRERFLTPLGWEKGSFCLALGTKGEAERPEDCVLVIRYTLVVRKEGTKPVEHVEEIWRKHGADEVIKDLLQKHGEAEKSL